MALIAEPVEIEVEGVRPDADAPAGAVVVPIGDQLPPGADVGDALAGVPGAVVRRLGGLGAYTEVSLRGSTSRQVEVQLDGIPLDPDGASITNLAELPLWAFREIRVWKSNPPILAGPGGVGGVVDLVTGDPSGMSGAISGGSFGAATGRALFADPHLLVAADALALQGDFPFFADGGTPFTAADDRIETRENADKRQVNALFRARGGDRVSWTALDAALTREEGVPGFTFATADAVRYAAARNLAAVEVEAPVGAARVGARGWSVVRTEALDDPGDEIGLGTGGSGADLASGGLRAHAAVAARPWLLATGLVEGRLERWSSRDPAGDASRRRVVVRAAAAGNAFVGDVEVVPSLWGLVLADEARSAAYPLPRVGAVWRPAPVLRMTANFGRTVRPPDPDELAGDRGAFVGNPDLRPEDAWQFDLGARAGDGSVHADVGGWWREVVDLIVFVQDAAQVAHPVNLGRARVRGLDLGVSASSSGVAVDGAATLLDTANRSEDPAYAGNALPRLPAFELACSASARRGFAQVGYTGSFTAGNWLDAANVNLAPPRTLHGLFARAALGGGWSLTGDVRNVANSISAPGPRDPLVDDGEIAVRAITDFTGYPLPGRTFLLGVAWSSPGS
jgi:iron complex outermembrane receptor protein